MGLAVLAHPMNLLLCNTINLQRATRYRAFCVVLGLQVTRRVETVEDLISKHSVVTAPDLSQRLQLLQQKHILAATLKVRVERAVPIFGRR